MIDDLIASPLYWSVFIGAMLLFLPLKYKPLDFKFFVVLPIAQRIAHLACLPSSYTSSLIFALLSAVLLMIGYRFVLGLAPSTEEAAQPNDPRLNIDHLEVKSYIVLAGLFLAGYFLLRFALYPQFLYSLDLGDRLQAQVDHRYLFFLKVATPPALTAIATRWIVNDGLNRWDKLLAFIVFIGLLSSGSKGSIAPLFLTYLGIAMYVGKAGMFRRAMRVIVPMTIFLSLMLIFLFPTLSGLEIVDMILYRVVANTEELEYLYWLDFQPDQYPFAGIGALLAPIAKLLGENIDYSPGVWLYGQRYGVWSGFGPNSGFIVELFGNLGFFGLAAPLLIGGWMGYCERRLTTYRVVLLSIFQMAFTESLIFFIALGGHVGLMLAAKLSAGLLRRGGRDAQPGSRQASSALADSPIS